MTLTREEILAMKPGRKLDALIKEHIFKFDLSGFEWSRVENSMFKNTDDAVTWIDIPNYSTDISEAWEVVNKLKEDVPPVRHVFRRLMGGIQIFDITPDVICKAALLAVLNL